MSASARSTAPILIVGAGRSGTKLLRRMLSLSRETASFPREINYIWRHGNIDYPTDALQPVHARPEVRAYIRDQFARFGRRHSGRRIVEKTCANALRVSFVHKIFPEAFIIHLVRDGRAVAESARRRWRAAPDWRYLLEKLRWVPVGDMPYYFLRYARFQLGRWRQGSEKAQTSWGPRFEGIDRCVAERTLLEVCAYQWKSCVTSAAAELSLLPEAQRMTIHYEDLAVDPLKVMFSVYSHVGLAWNSEVETAIRQIQNSNHNHKWKQLLNEQEINRLHELIGAELSQFGYDKP